MREQLYPKPTGRGDAITFALWLGIAALMGAVLFGCAGHHPPVVWPAVVECAGRSTDAAAPKVSRVLITGGDDWRSGLEDAAWEFGTELVECTVAELLHEWNDQTQAGALAPGAWQGRERAATFLDERKAVVR